MISSLNKLLELDSLLLEHVVYFERISILDHLLPWINCLAQGGLIWLLLMLYLAAFHSLKGRKIFFLGSISMLLAFAFSQGLNYLVHRPRPFNAISDVLPLANLLADKPAGYSFPSQQTALAFAAVTVLLSNCEKKIYKIFVFLLAALIGYSRVYAGLCYPLDVLGSAVLGSLCARYVMAKMSRIRRRTRKKRTYIVRKSNRQKLTEYN
ncbi:phosphoesterase PA-phosphatase related [Desulfofarcimen acetoxidans DSM 771]|uniref:Phosphoesterase PA-phosphatase related n=1 Tax=Desulfofarcimen acetoxidans (strain ATCC 49208 / DSM 771 / KCTC 5769 / VKM B-1644 / 5575) TaxID=485916 RepID=C8W5P9_DESAS|nr:phosphatase PAP2 family protein [Desulfofarcimen acetoxidans]ACV64049.1 phosphoesterase PA-phosphatase related [Desulfofarcimen acetoxidans DSM 771]